MSQFYWIVLITILSPYLHLLLPLISKIGIFLLVIWIITGCLSNSITLKPKRKRYGLEEPAKKKCKIEDYTEFLDSSIPIQRLQKSILQVLHEMIVSGFQKVSTKFQVPSEHLKSVNRYFSD
jgi:hypothetical protein